MTLSVPLKHPHPLSSLLLFCFSIWFFAAFLYVFILGFMFVTFTLGQQGNKRFFPQNAVYCESSSQLLYEVHQWMGLAVTCTGASLLPCKSVELLNAANFLHLPYPVCSTRKDLCKTFSGGLEQVKVSVVLQGILGRCIWRAMIISP